MMCLDVKTKRKIPEDKILSVIGSHALYWTHHLPYSDIADQRLKLKENVIKLKEQKVIKLKEQTGH